MLGADGWGRKGVGRTFSFLKADELLYKVRGPGYPVQCAPALPKLMRSKSINVMSSALQAKSFGSAALVAVPASY